MLAVMLHADNPVDLSCRVASYIEIDMQGTSVEAVGLPAGAVDLRNTLESRLAVQLPPTLVFDHPTVQALVDYITSLSPNDNQQFKVVLFERSHDFAHEESLAQEVAAAIAGVLGADIPEDQPLMAAGQAASAF